MQLQEDDGRTAALQNAHYLATAAELAYLNEPEGPVAFQEQLKLSARLIAFDNTQAYIATDDSHIVLAFRGSERPTSIDGLKDWLLTNANNFLIIPEGDEGTDFAAAGVGARFHRGFMTALAMVWDRVFAGVQEEIEKKERLLWVTGHSLGGALALLAAWRLRKKFVPVHRVFTFGAPMVGNRLAAEAFDREMADRIYRFVGAPDLVPWLPSLSLIANEYRHCNREMSLASVVEGTSETADQSLQAVAAASGDVFDGSVMDSIWKLVQNRLDAHDIVNYRSQIKGEADRVV